MIVYGGKSSSPVSSVRPPDPGASGPPHGHGHSHGPGGHTHGPGGHTH
jgi:hypothetical protein